MTDRQDPPSSGGLEPSPWVARFAASVPPGGRVLDVAAGGGRHTRLFLAAGHPVTAVDRDVAALVALDAGGGLEIVAADLEADPWPFGDRRFAGAVVTNYLWRPILPAIVQAVAPGGVLIYETFAVGNERFGKPRKADFLLRPGELLAAVADQLVVRAYEFLEEAIPRPAVRQRIAATRPPGPAPSG